MAGIVEEVVEKVPESDEELDGVKWSPRNEEERFLIGAMDYDAMLTYMNDVVPCWTDEKAVVCLDGIVSDVKSDTSLRDDVGAECEQFGSVVDVSATECGDGVRVFVVFGRSFRHTPVESARAAVAGMNGRLFDGRAVRASLFDLTAYQQAQRCV